MASAPSPQALTAPTAPTVSTAPTVLLVCTTCRAAAAPGLPATEGAAAPAGQQLHAQVLRLADASVRVVGQACLAACGSGCTAALQAAGKASHVFGRLRPDAEHARALLEVARQHAASPEGQLPWSERPPCLRGATLARLPPLPQREEGP